MQVRVAGFRPSETIDPILCARGKLCMIRKAT
jgi:hypothetical protein